MKLKLVVIIVLAALLGFLTRQHWLTPLQEWATGRQSEPAPPLARPADEVGRTYSVKRVQVLKGDQFDLVLDNEGRILAKLRVRAAEGAKPKVVDLLNHSENPKVRLVQQQPDGQWLVDFLLVHNGKDVDLAGWLSDNKLVYK